MLNDLVIDRKHGFIYIADSGLYVPSDKPLNGSLIVLDIRKEPYRERRILGATKWTNNNESFWLEINGVKVEKDKPMRTGSDGIALTPDCEELIFCPLSST